MDRHGRQTPSTPPWGGQPGNSGRFLRRLLIMLALVLAGSLALLTWLPPVALDPERGATVVRTGLVLALVIVGIAGSRRRLSVVARDLAIWAGVLVFLVVGYSYRFELQHLGDRVVAELVPGHGLEQASGRSISFRRGEDRQFTIDALVDGHRIRFLLDTGASAVVLTRADAARLGFDPGALNYSQSFQTANGTTRGAPVRLGEIRIGTAIRFTDIPAYVNAGDLDESLLGMGALERLGRIEISEDRLTIGQ